ncbi:MAG: c-type cytochrome biogenesis protein CcmI [Halioglobus sp.]|nr:c-type cytochrome biogenesis protein CcmI [Halioglobus sp.]
MTAFYLVCAAMVLLSGIFYLFPRAPRNAVIEDPRDANLEWFRLRREELAREGDDSLEEDIRVRLLEDAHQAQAPVQPRNTRFPGWVLFAFVALSSAGLYHLLGGAGDVVISRQLQSLDANTSPAQMDQVIAAIETRAAQRPDNLHYLALLGRYYMGQQDYAAALATYDSLLQSVPEDAQALAYAAQAEYLAAGRQLNDSARLKAEQALAANPHQRTALGLLGMASYEQGRYRAAIEYWERLLATEPPNSESARMIAGVLASAREQLGEAPLPADGPAGTPTPATAGVSVSLSLPPGAQVNASDTLFVLARSALSDSRMPIAVQRLQVGQLPTTLRLDDGNSMAGQKLSAAESVVVVAQVSPSGRPGEANATWVGTAGPLTPAVDAEPVTLVLAPNTP